MKKVIQTKKLVLVLVEGKSDEESLEYVLSKLVRSEKVKFVICRGDITSDYRTTPRNIAQKITLKIKEFLDNSQGLYTEADINLIVHIVDTDACSIDDDCVIESEVNEYTDKIVKTTNKQNIIDRNRRKLLNLKTIKELNCLSFYPSSLCIPYISYYMSCNLEHVLHNNPNIDSDKEKEYYSMVFSDKFFNKISEFITFINSKGVGTELSFVESWNNILKPENALRRETNLNLFVNDYINED